MKAAVFFLIFSVLARQIDSRDSVNTVEDGVLRVTGKALETGVYTLSLPEEGSTVVLVGVVHIAEKDYYAKIRSMMQDMDVVLYEGIRLTVLDGKFGISEMISQNTKGADLAPEEYFKYRDWIAARLNLAKQSEQLRPGPNWIHADLTYSEFMSIFQRNGRFSNGFNRYLTLDNKNMLKEYNDIKDIDTNNLEYSSRILNIKRNLAKNFISSANALCFNYEYLSVRNSLITERNKIAVNQVQKRLRNGIPVKMGIIFGAAHIPDFLSEFQSKFGFTVVSHEWLTAWNLN